MYVPLATSAAGVIVATLLSVVTVTSTCVPSATFSRTVFVPYVVNFSLYSITIFSSASTVEPLAGVKFLIANGILTVYVSFLPVKDLSLPFFTIQPAGISTVYFVVLSGASTSSSVKVSTLPLITALLATVIVAATVSVFCTYTLRTVTSLSAANSISASNSAVIVERVLSTFTVVLLVNAGAASTVNVNVSPAYSSPSTLFMQPAGISTEYTPLFAIALSSLNVMVLPSTTAWLVQIVVTLPPSASLTLIAETPAVVPVPPAVAPPVAVPVPSVAAIVPVPPVPSLDVPQSTTISLLNSIVIVCKDSTASLGVTAATANGTGALTVIVYSGSVAGAVQELLLTM